jgi:hypothetical protein
VSHPSIRVVRRFAATTILAVVLAIPCTGHAGDGRVVRRGDCTGRSGWKLDVRTEDGRRLRVSFEIEGGRAGQDWHVFLSDDGVGIFSGARTSGAAGSLEVRVRTTDRAGSDTIKAAANNVVSGESCAGRATL